MPVCMKKKRQILNYKPGIFEPEQWQEIKTEGQGKYAALMPRWASIGSQQQAKPVIHADHAKKQQKPGKSP